MEHATPAEVGRNVVQVIEEIRQILPTLATKDELRSETAATKDELRSEIAATRTELKEEIATLREEMRAEGRTTRRHFDVVAEGLRTEICALADGIIANQERIEHVRLELKGDVAGLDRRVTRLEASRRVRR